MAEGDAIENASDARRRDKQRSAIARRHTFAGGNLNGNGNPGLDPQPGFHLNPQRLARQVSGLRLIDNEEAESVASSKTSRDKGKTAFAGKARRGSVNFTGPDEESSISSSISSSNSSSIRPQTPSADEYIHSCLLALSNRPIRVDMGPQRRGSVVFEEVLTTMKAEAGSREGLEASTEDGGKKARSRKAPLRKSASKPFLGRRESLF